MKLYAIYGEDELYQGGNGIRYTQIIEAESKSEALNYADELSENVIEDFPAIYESLEKDIQDECIFREIPFGEGSFDEDEIREEIYYIDKRYGAIELNKNKLPTLDIHELDKMFSNNFEDFIEEFGI